MPVAECGEGDGCLVALRATIGVDNLDERKGLARLPVQNPGYAGAILNICRMCNNIQHEPERIDNDLVFDGLDFLAGMLADRVGASPRFEAERTL